MVLDEEHLYWSMSDGSLWQGDHEGRQSPERLVQQTNSAGTLAVDTEHLYWTNVGKIVAYEKATRATHDLPMGRPYLAPRIILDEQNVYVLEVGCRSMGIVPKNGDAADLLDLPSGSMGSVSAAAQDADYVYCGNYTSSGANGTQSPSVYRRGKRGGPAERVATFDELDRNINPQIYALANIRGALHVAIGSKNATTGLSEHSLFSVPAAGGAKARVVGPITRALQADGMVCDDALETCYYWSLPGVLLMAYDVRNARVLGADNGIAASGSGPVQDAHALYWPALDGVYRQDKLSRPSASAAGFGNAP